MLLSVVLGSALVVLLSLAWQAAAGRGAMRWSGPSSSPASAAPLLESGGAPTVRTCRPQASAVMQARCGSSSSLAQEKQRRSMRSSSFAHAFRTPGVSWTGKTVFGRPCHCLLALGSGLGLVRTASSRR